MRIKFGKRYESFFDKLMSTKAYQTLQENSE